MGWETRQLASICEVFADGDWIESKDQSETGVRLIQTGNIGEGVFKDRAEKARYVSAETFQRLRCTEIFPGDCLISRLPDPVGRACIVPDTGEAMITAVDCTIVRFREGVYLPEFFTYYSQSLSYLTAVDAETTGTTRKRISRARLGQIAVPGTPLPEQRRIVAILDEAFEAIAIAKANAEKNLRNARELFEGHLRAVFTQRGPRWVDKQLEDCIEDVKYPAKVQRKHFLEEGEFPVVSQEAEFINGFWDNAEDVFRVAKPVVVFGDHTRVFKYIDFDFVLGADGVKILSPKSFMSPKYFFYALRSAPLKSLGYARHYRILKELQVSYPDTSEQVEIARKIELLEEETQRLSLIFERKITALEELRKSLLHQAFAGQLTAKQTDQQLEAVA